MNLPLLIFNSIPWIAGTGLFLLAVNEFLNRTRPSILVHSDDDDNQQGS